MTKLIYIGGYGHSGSTLLEYLMASNPSALACGEVVSCIRQRAGKQKRCTCGRVAKDCPVWGFFHSSDDASHLTHAELLRALLQRADSQYAVIVDSSKTAWGSYSMPFRLKRKFGPEFMLIHLIRDPTAVCWSVLKQKNLRAKREGRSLRHYMLRCSWMAFGWWLANLSCDLFGMIYPRHYLRLRYEDLARSPVETLRMLFERLLPDVGWDSDEPCARDNRHQLYGNKTRRRHLTLEHVKEDLKWKVEMPSEYHRVVLSLSYLLRLRYGYS